MIAQFTEYDLIQIEARTRHLAQFVNDLVRTPENYEYACSCCDEETPFGILDSVLEDQRVLIEAVRAAR